MRIYSIIIGIPMLYYTLGINVYVNINMDYLPINVSNLKIYERKVNVSHCAYLRNDGDLIFLKVDKSLKSSICTSSQVTFYVFIYHSNITSAIIKVQNEYASVIIATIIKRLRRAVVLDVQDQYAIFIMCKNTFLNCEYENINHREPLKWIDLNVYSACGNMRAGDSCLTDVEFRYELNDMDSGQKYLGTTIKIKSTNMKPQYELLNCKNGGVLENDNVTQRMKCICPNTSKFIERGPRCEVTQQRLNQKQYIYCLPNTNQLDIEFSFISTGIDDEHINIFKIENENNKIFMMYTKHINKHIITVNNQSLQLNYTLTDPFTWLDAYIRLSHNRLDFRLNEKTTEMNFINPVPMMLDTFPLIFDHDGKIEMHKICISNFKVNFNIVDLNTPNHEPCVKSQCQDCTNDEKCVYWPFHLTDTNKCICKAGLVRSEDSKSCIKDSNMVGQLSKGVIKNIRFNAVPILSLSLGFRTLLKNGILIKYFVSPNVIGIKITEGVVSIILTNIFTFMEKTIPNYNVADGEWHIIQINLKNYRIEVTLDESQPYNSARLFFVDRWAVKQEMDVVVLGPWTESVSSNQNLSTCYDSITIVPNVLTNDLKEYNIVLNESLSEGCSGGRNCSCGDNQQCVEKWQNNTCVCENNFVDMNGTCIFPKCQPNPCLNNGVCSYNKITSGHQCECVPPYSGVYCETIVVISMFRWWIILIVVLILLVLLIAIMLYFLCYKRSNDKKELADINVVYENAVAYFEKAGEDDYKGAPINFGILKEASKTNEKLSEDPKNIYQDLVTRKEYHDINNKDLILDEPLEYGFEGVSSRAESVSSFGSNESYAKINRKTMPI